MMTAAETDGDIFFWSFVFAIFYVVCSIVFPAWTLVCCI